MNIMDPATLAAHVAICEDSPGDCLEWDGRCVKAVEAAAPHIIAALAQIPADHLIDEME